MAPSNVDVEFRGLLVKVSAKRVRGMAKGKLYLIPENSLSQFEFSPPNKAQIDAHFAKSEDKLINVDYAVFRQNMVLQGSSG